ncbi:hypothetical protein BU24DRAFT_229453 [Aaosphaeria arxii CBS 175.79]|uniref:Uncharacterized protein n=1 Tax=Aaosphaeria arxii CBS 175.79 TaxID=1450172 RepID=A0A6A5XQM2_9PLEO|nr:uncharacterized protein BU24DRAFT_229453 [Aaosphaeria arxii CBS 175.79]KAF2015196.1 hypothetical protein BU24DRAFT_229453 [Aaosphaeria arxii CBS 175.79]
MYGDYGLRELVAIRLSNCHLRALFYRRTKPERRGFGTNSCTTGRWPARNLLAHIAMSIQIVAKPGPHDGRHGRSVAFQRHNQGAKGLEQALSAVGFHLGAILIAKSGTRRRTPNVGSILGLKLRFRFQGISKFVRLICELWRTGGGVPCSTT